MPSCFCGGPQNREVHEIDGGVRLEQIAPDALAGVRLARNQEHAQVLAHAFGRDHHPIVSGGELAGRRFELDLDDVLPGVRERHLNLHGPTDRGRARFVGPAFAANFQRDAIAALALAPGFDAPAASMSRA